MCHKIGREKGFYGFCSKIFAKKFGSKVFLPTFANKKQCCIGSTGILIK